MAGQHTVAQPVIQEETRNARERELWEIDVSREGLGPGLVMGGRPAGSGTAASSLTGSVPRN